MTDTATHQAPQGWYDDGYGRQRWWDGAQWTQHYADQRPVQQQPVQQVFDPNTQAQILNREVANYAQHGWVVQSATHNQAVLSRVKRMGWFWNTIGVIVTAGLWLIYVIYRALNRKTESLILTVAPNGHIDRRFS